MTQNQIEYWKLQETRRANKANESETKRHNLTNEGISAGQLGEAHRHNLASESIDISKLHESVRHNQATESEAYRHNTAVEQKDLGMLEETKRHNKAYEQYWMDTTSIGQQNAETNVYQAETQRLGTTADTLFGKTGIIPWLVTGGVAAKTVAAAKSAQTAAASAQAAATTAKLQNVPKVANNTGQSIFVIPKMSLDIFEKSLIGGSSAQPIVR